MTSTPDALSVSTRGELCSTNTFDSLLKIGVVRVKYGSAVGVEDPHLDLGDEVRLLAPREHELQRVLSGCQKQRVPLVLADAARAVLDTALAAGREGRIGRRRNRRRVRFGRSGRLIAHRRHRRGCQDQQQSEHTEKSSRMKHGGQPLFSSAVPL